MYPTYKHTTRFFAAALILLLATSCHTARKAMQVSSINSLHLLGSYVVPHAMKFKGTTVGGLSGIDYDPARNVYYVICDDRSSYNPARFYTAQIGVSEKGIDSVHFIEVTYLRQPNGDVYPNSKQDAYHTPDPESMRYNPVRDQLVWGSEGERIVKKDTIVLEDPSIITISRSGAFIDSFRLPANMHMHADAHGPRQNGVFEGLTFTENFKTLLVNVEEPIYEDGPRAGLGDSSAWIRILRFDVATHKPRGQFAYRIDPVPYAPVPAGAFKINGVPDILAINNHELLVMERAFSTGRRACTIKIYLSVLDAAQDISDYPDLANVSLRHPITKKLLLNMESLDRYIDNVEGMTLGPLLPNGHRTLVMVADNNFDEKEETQFFVFEIL